MKVVLRHDSGVDNQGDINSHDSDMIAYESNGTSIPSIEVSFPSDSVSQSEEIAEDNSVDPTMDVEVVPLRRLLEIESRLNFLATLGCTG